jgi:hypothetical protein
MVWDGAPELGQNVLFTFNLVNCFLFGIRTASPPFLVLLPPFLRVDDVLPQMAS